ncbi:hypothetical protein ACFSRY_12335 [Pontibacter locisalis]|uniref:Uncharacterized protein n=1 Tax=Pontibacter locisalis TaxID=1719035 RepID=A0ABW5IRL4_9BACT
MKNRYRCFVILIVAVVQCTALEAEATGFSFCYHGASTSAPKQEEQEARRMKKELLGSYHETNLLTTDNISHAYLIFMENVRSKQSSWGNSEWELAQETMNQLNARFTSIYSILRVSDKARIKVVQTEFKKLREKSVAKK